MTPARQLTLLCIGFLAGCALRPTAPVTPAARPGQRIQLLALPAWEARGRIAIKVTVPAGEADAGNSRPAGGQGSIRWVQSGDSARVRLSGPFGAGAYELQWDPGHVTVTTGNGTKRADYTGPDAAEQFVREQLGFSFPVASTRYWLLGLADPAMAGSETFDAAGRLAALNQQGWQIRYDDYVLRAGLWLPRKLVLENERGRLRLVLDDWQL